MNSFAGMRHLQREQKTRHQFAAQPLPTSPKPTSAAQPGKMGLGNKCRLIAAAVLGSDFGASLGHVGSHDRSGHDRIGVAIGLCPVPGGDV